MHSATRIEHDLDELKKISYPGVFFYWYSNKSLQVYMHGPPDSPYE